MTNTELEAYRDAGTQTIFMPDGTTKAVRMSPEHWGFLEVIKRLEGVTDAELAAFALEECELQSIDFDLAFRAVIAHLVKRWK